MTSAPPLLIGPEFLVQRVGQRWYVVVRWQGTDHRSEPYASREVAVSTLDRVRENYVAHMERNGFGTTMVRQDEPEGDA